MTVTVRYFASLREALGSSEQFDDAAGLSLGELRDRLIARGEPHASALARGRAVRCALDKQMCDEAALIGEGAEVAFFPPVTGG
ncbi:MoaD/ThiS family protein [Pelomonas sp. SE-A7]|uniref:MoaD/ThiS family protein n=1 Tax=Pelomonas sp. SE-A7 TaxID=3054953 RepID=UPI00259CB786|nr:MoaD/ThiS family protein [Pelomonas sp. SE-A7]MDM4765823.1 MoaD/ThiS family protein [Pelomonas sp. SE-A7]